MSEFFEYTCFDEDDIVIGLSVSILEFRRWFIRYIQTRFEANGIHPIQRKEIIILKVLLPKIQLEMIQIRWIQTKSDPFLNHLNWLYKNQIS
jgi:hypothetical protein